MPSASPGHRFGGISNPFTVSSPQSQVLQFDFLQRSNKCAAVQWLKRDGKTYVRLPSILKWCEKDYGEVVCALSMFSWSTIGYRVLFHESTRLEGRKLCEFSDSFSRRFVPGQQLFVDVAISQVRAFGEDRSSFSDCGSVVHVYADSLSLSDGSTTFPLLHASDVTLRTFMALRADPEGTVFEGWDITTDETCVIALPMQHCARIRRDVRVRNGLPLYHLGKGEHVCPAQLSMLPLSGLYTSCPEWLSSMLPSIPEQAKMLVDYAVYGGWHFSFATIVGFTDCSEDPNMELMEVSIEDVSYNLHYGSSQVYQHKRPEADRGHLLSTKCALYMHRTLPEWGQAQYAIRMWLPNSPQILVWHSARRGRPSLREYPTESTEPQLKPYFHEFASKNSEYWADFVAPEKVTIYKEINLDMEELRVILDRDACDKGQFPSIDSNEERVTVVKEILNPAMCMEFPSHAYPLHGCVWRDRSAANVPLSFDPRWLMSPESSENVDEHLRKILIIGLHCLHHERQLLTSGFRLRIDWSSLFLRLSRQSPPPTIRQVRDAVHNAILSMRRVVQDYQNASETSKWELPLSKRSAEDEFETRIRRIRDCILHGKLPSNGFWPSMKRIAEGAQKSK